MVGKDGRQNGFLNVSFNVLIRCTNKIRWLGTQHPLASTSRVLGLQAAPPQSEGNSIC